MVSGGKDQAGTAGPSVFLAKNVHPDFTAKRLVFLPKSNYNRNTIFWKR